MRRVGVTEHAVERYIERVRPDLTPEAARVELIRLVHSAPAVEPPPGCGRPRLCLMVAPGVFVPCDNRPGSRNRYSAKTVLVV